MDKEQETSPAPNGEEQNTETGGQVTDPGQESAHEENDNPDATSADSSTAGTDAKDKPDSLLDVVKDAVKPKGEKDASSDPKEGKEEADSKKQEGDSDAKKDKDEDLPPFHKHPRWQQMLDEKAAAEKSINEMKPGYEQYQRIEDFMGKNNLSSDNVVEGFKIMALLRNDPERAKQELLGYIKQIDDALGYTLPQDLQDDVEAGRITEERALELSKARRNTERANDYARQATERSTQADRNRAVEQLRADVRAETNTWKAEKAKSDPDFAVKERLVMDRVGSIVRGRQERPYLASVEDTRQVLEQAYKDVSDYLAKSFSTRKEIRKDPSPGQSQNRGSTVSAEPGSMLDAVKQGFANARKTG